MAIIRLVNGAIITLCLRLMLPSCSGLNNFEVEAIFCLVANFCLVRILSCVNVVLCEFPNLCRYQLGLLAAIQVGSGRQRALYTLLAVVSNALESWEGTYKSALSKS